MDESLQLSADMVLLMYIKIMINLAVRRLNVYVVRMRVHCYQGCHVGCHSLVAVAMVVMGTHS